MAANYMNVFSGADSSFDYNPPPDFKIGDITTKALVDIAQIKNHLSLLHALAELKNSIDNVGAPVILNVPMDKEKRWAWFVGCAVERFDVWCRSLKDTDLLVATEIIMPPLDVVMVWHAYMLNPKWYAEDCARRDACRRLKGLEKQFNECLAGKFSQIFSQPPSYSRVKFWQTKTSQTFGCSLNGVNAINKKTINCHDCALPIIVDLVNREGTGYLQNSFRTTCTNTKPHEHRIITKETLAVRKIVTDMFSGNGKNLAGLDLISPNEQRTRVRSSSKVMLNTVLSFSGPRRELDYARSMGYAMSSIREKLGEPNKLTNRMLTAYTSEKIYSVELVGAVLRQESFVRKMYDLGWTRPRFFDDRRDELALYHAIARYHAFLDLISSSPRSFFVPTLDIDLVWHTHQLFPSKYNEDCTTYCQRFIDHDDKVEGLHLSSAFNSTCIAWKKRFNINYSHCGCPTPDLPHLHRMKSFFSKPPEHLPQLAPYNRKDALEATHPSDHNAVRFVPTDEQARKEKEANYATLKREMEKMAKKAEADERRPHTFGHGRSGGDLGSVGTVTYNHYSTFLIPVPIHLPTLSCIAGDSGQHVQPSGSCGSGCGGGCGAGGGACGTGSNDVGPGGTGDGGASDCGASGGFSTCGGSGGCGGGGGGCG